jgi:hypothetical protein
MGCRGFGVVLGVLFWVFLSGLGGLFSWLGFCFQGFFWGTSYELGALYPFVFDAPFWVFFIYNIIYQKKKKKRDVANRIKPRRYINIYIYIYIYPLEKKKKERERRYFTI